MAAWGCSLFSVPGQVPAVGESEPGQRGQAAASPAAGMEPQGPVLGRVLASQRVAGRRVGSAWLGVACHVTDAGIKLLGTLLGVPTGLLAVAPNLGAAGREGASCELGSKAGRHMWSGTAVRVCFALWAGMGI